MKNLLTRLMALAGYMKSTPGDWKPASAPDMMTKPSSSMMEVAQQDMDEELLNISRTPVVNPALALVEAARTGEKFNGQYVTISEAHLFSARIGPDGKVLKEASAINKIRESEEQYPAEPYRIERVLGVHDLDRRLTEAEATIASHPAKARESMTRKLDVLKKLHEGGFSDSFEFDSSMSQYDPNQYTEYTPVMGGPHFKQLYLSDYLTMHARAFEAWNHNPLAKRIVKLLSQYAMGRGYKAVCADDKIQGAWDKFEKQFDIKKKMTRFWPSEYVVNGELMIDKVTWQSIDPSTIWDIVTDPDNVENVYYYHQTYPTRYLQFTGKTVAGVPGSDKTKPIEFIIRQLPYDRVIHLKGECYSNEARGRSKLFPVLGWLKRVKDIYNAGVIKAWLNASFLWDDTIKGSAADIQAHVSKYSSMPTPGSIFAHNEAIERKAVQPAQSSGAKDETAQEIIAFIGTAVGIPKEHLNLLTHGGSNRATALVSSEPFTKVIEEVQGDLEGLLHEIAEAAMAAAGFEFHPGDIEFVFPSVTKDTTSETIKNILAGEQAGFLSKKNAANMFAAEMNITTYDFDREVAEIEQEKAAGLALVDNVVPSLGVMPEPGLPQPPAVAAPKVEPPVVPEAKLPSPIHGQPKVDLQKVLNR